jgi:glycosyltransferase involved in cell wall biosynthesis
MKIAFCAASEEGRSWSLDFSGIDVEFLPGRQFSNGSSANPFKLKWNSTVRQSLANFSPDVAVLSGYSHPTVQLAAHWCRQHGIPYGIVCESNLRTAKTSGLRWRFKKTLLAPMVRGMSFGMPLGREASEYLNLLCGVQKPMFYFPNTPDVDPIVAEADRVRREGDGASIRHTLGIPDDGKIVLFVGRLIEVKRPLDALRAFLALDQRSADDIRLVFVGDGPLMPAIREAAATDPRVYCVGWVRDPKLLAALMAISDAMLLPSESETWGAVVNEAMAAELPVIASDHVGAAVELIEHGLTGYIHAVGDISAISDALGRVLFDTDLRHRIGNAARAKALASGHENAAASLVAAADYAVRLRQ